MINIISTEDIDVHVNKIFNKEQECVIKGLFIAYDYQTKLWIAVDHRSCEYYLKEFKDLDDAINYLRRNETYE